MKKLTVISILLLISFVKAKYENPHKDSCITPEILGGKIHVVSNDDNYSLSEVGKVLSQGTEIIVTCDEGYDVALNGLVDEDFALTCSKGQLPPLPSCVPVPTAIGELDDSEDYENEDPGTVILLARRYGSKSSRRRRAQRCSYELKNDLILAFHNGSLVQKNTTFANGTILSFRCQNISTFAFVGNSTRICVRGNWQGKQARCVRLYPHSFYSQPVITYLIETGNVSIRGDGALLVTNGSNATFKCLWLRENAEPHWRKNGHDIKNHRNSPVKTRWNKKDDSFELFIPLISDEYSGNYICATPNRKMNVIKVVVIAKPEPQVDFGNSTQENVTELPEKAITCDFSPQLLNGIYSYNGIHHIKQNFSFDSGAVIYFRCHDIFQFSFEGNKTNECKDGQWLNQWPKCIHLKADSSDSAPPLDVQLTPSDKIYTITNKGQLIIPQESTAIFYCRYSPSKPILGLHGTKLRFTTGASRSGGITGWYLRVDLPSYALNFTFVCKIPRKDVELMHSLAVSVQNTCKIDDIKRHPKWRMNLIKSQVKNIFAEGEIFELQCDGVTPAIIPSFLKCGEQGNWIHGPNQKCKINVR